MPTPWHPPHNIGHALPLPVARAAARGYASICGRQRNHLITLAIFSGQFGRLKAMYSPE
jgi:hypothetical protein